MAVQVVTGRTQGVESKEAHPKADSFHIKEGHLVVTKWGGSGDEPVAIYVPGQWLNAKVIDEKTS